MLRPEYVGRKLRPPADRDTFLRLADLGVRPPGLAAEVARSAGLGDSLVHDANDVDRRIVRGALRTCLEQYHRYGRSVDAFLKREAGS